MSELSDKDKDKITFAMRLFRDAILSMKEATTILGGCENSSKFKVKHSKHIIDSLLERAKSNYEDVEYRLFLYNSPLEENEE